MGDLVIAEADLAGAAVLDAVAGEAAVGVIGEDDGEDFLAHLGHLGGVGADDHAVGDLGGAGEREAAHALDFDGAGAAAGVGGQSVEVAKVEIGKPAFLITSTSGARSGASMDWPLMVIVAMPGPPLQWARTVAPHCTSRMRGLRRVWRNVGFGGRG